MGTFHDGVKQPEAPFALFSYLDEIDSILDDGAVNKQHFWPFLENVYSSIEPYGAGSVTNHIASVNASGTNTSLDISNVGFQPYRHPGGVHSYNSQGAGSGSYYDSDDTSYTYLSGTDDIAFSLGLWIKPTATPATRALITKYDITAAAEAREYNFGIDGSSNLFLSLYDESVGLDPDVASETATGDTVLASGRWYFVTATYDGTGGASANAGITLYVNAAAETPVLTDNLTYVAMENLGGYFRINASEGTGGAIERIFDGRIALPFLTGKELTAAQVGRLYTIGRILLGL